MSNAVVVPMGHAAQRVVEAYQAAGGVVEYVLIDAGTAEAAERHRTAAVAGLAEIVRSWQAEVDRRSAENDPPRGQLPAIRTDPERATGSAIPLRDFLGRAYDWKTGRVVSLWTRRGDGGAKHAAGEFLTGGYAEAFSDPPYGLHIDLAEINSLFEQINTELLGGLHDTLEVWQWSTDWSAWFEPGSEWWGAYLWTAAPADRPWITVIAASATD